MPPIRSNLPQKALPQKVNPTPTTPSLDALNIRSSPLFRKRRNLVLAGAVAVITIAGTLIGASLKSKQQTTEKKVLEIILLKKIVLVMRTLLTS
jgi:hypothetical protein